MAEQVASLTGSERRALRLAAKELALVQTGGSPGDVFQAIARCVPVVGGLIGTLGSDGPSSPVSHVVKLPAPVIEAWASTPPDQLARMLAPMVGAGPGKLVSDTQAIVGPFREELHLLRRLDDAGLGESAGYKMSTHATHSGGAVHHFMTFALERRESFTEGHRTALALLQPGIQAALGRLAVPLIASQSIMLQIVSEQSIGLLCTSPQGRIVEFNQRMYELVTRYSKAARIDGWRGILARFTERALVETGRSQPWWLWHDDGRAAARVHAHRLAREAHPIGEDLLLIHMNEVFLRPPPGSEEPPPAFEGLTKRQQEIARALVQSGLSRKEIGAKLGISVGTVNKHAEHIHSSLGVHSRAELVEAAKKWRPS